jgi:membrane protein implicated in regulation of membrane protease activity
MEGDGFMSYASEWTAVPVFLGAPLLLLVPGFALIAVIVVALVAIAALVALAAAVLATPYLVVRAVRRRLAERHRPTAASVTNHPSLTALAEPTTARS